MGTVYKIRDLEVDHKEWQDFVRVLSKIDPKKARDITSDNKVDDFEMYQILDRDSNGKVEHADFKNIKNPLFGQVLAILRKYNFEAGLLHNPLWCSEHKEVPEQFWTDKDFVLSATSDLYRCHEALEFANIYKHLPFAKAAIENVTKDNPYLAFMRADRYKDAPYAEEVLKQAAEKDPRWALYFADRYKDMPYAKTVIGDAAEKSPGLALSYADRFKNTPYAGEILEKAAQKNPSMALWNLGQYKDRPYARNIIEIALESEEYASDVLGRAHLYKDQPYAKDVILKITEKYPEAAFSDLKEYKDMPYAKEVLVKAAAKAPEKAWFRLDDYKDMHYAMDVLKVAVKREPDLAFYTFRRYKTMPYAKEILKDAVKMNPEYAYQHLGKYADMPYTQEILDEAAEMINDEKKVEELLKQVLHEPDMDKRVTRMIEAENKAKNQVNVPKDTGSWWQTGIKGYAFSLGSPFLYAGANLLWRKK